MIKNIIYRLNIQNQKIFLYTLIITLISGIIVISGCSDNHCRAKFDGIVREYISDGELSIADQVSLTDKVLVLKSNFRKCIPSIFDGNDINKEKLMIEVKKAGTRLDINFTIPEDKPQFNVKAYIENSSSMYGYISGRTEFKDVIQSLLIDVEHYFQSVEINYINSVIYKQDFGPENIWREVSLTNKRFKVGNIGSTDINKAFDLVLNETNDNTVTIFISDCIYSIKGTNTIELLDNEKNLLKRSFLEKRRHFDLDSYCAQYESDFNGYYYDMDDTPLKVSNVKRPYYIWIFGSEGNVNYILKKIDFLKYSGFSNCFLFSGSMVNQMVSWTVLPETVSEISFKTNRDHKAGDLIQGLENVNLRKKDFTVAVGVDLSGLLNKDSGILDYRGYSLSGNNTMSKIRIVTTSDLHQNDYQRFGKNISHFFTITSEGFPDAVITVKYNYEFPDWINQSSTENDKKFQTDMSIRKKTFGFSYMGQGIWESYNIDAVENAVFKLELYIEH